MFKKFSILVCALAALFSFSFTPQAKAQGGGGDYRVVARGGSRDAAQIKGVYRERAFTAGLQQRFNVSVEDFAPNTRYEIRINGNLFGTITTSALGTAELEFRTFVVDDTPGDDHPPIPTDFPHLVAGDTISVGSVTATFR